MIQGKPSKVLAGGLVLAGTFLSTGEGLSQTLDRAVQHGSPRQTERDSVSPAWSASDTGFGGRATGRDTFSVEDGSSRPNFFGSVGQRRPDEGLRPEGGRIGAFLVAPSLGIRERFDSNLYSVETDEDHDFVTAIRPGVVVQSNWIRHSLAVSADANIGRHARFSSEDYEDFSVGVDGRIDILRGTALLVGGGYGHGHIARSSPDDTSSSSTPKTYRRANAYAELGRTLGQINGSADVTVTWTDFSDGATATGAIINNDVDNNLVIAPGVRLGYTPAPGTEVYARLRYMNAKYPDLEDDSLDRDTWGVDVLFGVEKAFNEVWTLGAYVGYAPRYLDDPDFSDIQGRSGLVGGADVTWNVTADTSAILNVSHRTDPTTSSGASAISATDVGLTVQKEFTRAVMADTRVRFTNSDYVGSDRVDQTYRAGVGVEYLVNRWVSFEAGYDFTYRDSNSAGSSYEDHSIMIGLRLAY